jgi:hypothetical protein
VTDQPAKKDDEMTDLWTVTIAFRGQNTSLRLIFNGERAAKEAFRALHPPETTFETERGLQTLEPAQGVVEITDGYGTSALVLRETVMCAWVTHLGSQAEGAKAEALLNAHAQASLQRRAQADPLLANSRGAPTPPFKLGN